MAPGRLRSALAAAGLLAAAAALGGGAGRSPVLSVEAAGGRALHREPVSEGAAFVLSYVHSSEHVPVRGTVRVEADGSLTVVETAFAGFGPGLPALTAGD
ncbi:MAG TPA: DUF1850 domain-containing protein, partial [Methylomirabilota bacterium]|nr:DUF1850 domain-containing protein [Methylomirabilota bacterium]